MPAALPSRAMTYSPSAPPSTVQTTPTVLLLEIGR